MTKSSRPRKSTVEAQKEIEVSYSLAELPSSQHRSGLAGLVLMLEWLARQPNRCGVAEILELSRAGARFRFDAEGVGELFDAVYSAATEEVERPRPMGSKKPLRTETRTVEKAGKLETKDVFIYQVVVPGGAFLAEYDPTNAGGQGLWLKLWRDLLWGILRGVPMQRLPFEARAQGVPTSDASDAWAGLCAEEGASLDLASTYYLGAMAKTGENVPFRDRQRYQFLLHFWQFVAQVHVPSVLDRDGSPSDLGYAIAIPDVADLKAFCGRFPAMMRQRDTAPSGFRPRAARVDLAIECGLDVLARLRERISETAGAQETGDLVLGVDVVHVHKPGNAVKVLGVTRLAPVLSMLDEYQRIKSTYWDHVFRRQRLSNLVNEREWFHGFDGVMTVLTDERFLKSHTFHHDVHEAFTKEGASMAETTANDPRPLETLVYHLIRGYVRERLRSKHGLEWSDDLKGTSGEGAYNEQRGKIARDAFLAVRSRTGSDFVEYFASTLCSTPQWLPETDYLALTRLLHEESERVRTLTLLALSAQGYSAKSGGRSSDNG